MINYFRFRELNSFLKEAGITGKPTDCVKFDLLPKSLTRIFNLALEDGKRNFRKVIEMIYDPYPAATRIKLLVLVHTLLAEDQSYAKLFLRQPRYAFQGIVITKKPSRQANETNGQVTLRGEQTSVSISRTCINRPCIDDAVDFKDVNTYLHLYLVQPYLGYLMKMAANYDLFEQCRQPLKQIRKADFFLIWKIINMVKSIMQVRVVLTHIGRYYFSDHNCIVGFVEMLTQSFKSYYELLEHHMTTALDSYKHITHDELENLLGILDQIVEINEGFYEIYYNRYFSQQLRHIAPPKWITLENDESEMIYHHFELEFGEMRRTVLKEPGADKDEHKPRERRIMELDEIVLE